MYEVKELAIKFDLSIRIIENWIMNNPEVKDLFVEVDRVSPKFNTRYKIKALPDRNLPKFLEYVEIRQKKTEIEEHWTKSAVDCWKRNLVCRGCDLEDVCRNNRINEYKMPDLQGKPPMKWKVLELVRKKGIPLMEER